MVDPVLEVTRLGFPWHGLDPFIFSVHHRDDYPAGDDAQGIPLRELKGRNIGSDFSYLDGWSMYHGTGVPGFPQHPHRGFETVTVVRRGYVDHSDSLGATARYGEGDTQWLTTGSGIQHSEMFPLVNPDGDNPLELFQIWLNLPPASKMVPAHFRMLWSEDIPTIEPMPGVSVDVIAGPIGNNRPPSPPPDSWGSQPTGDLAIWLIRVGAGSTWDLPIAPAEVNRVLYCFLGDGADVAGTEVSRDVGVRLRPELSTTITGGTTPSEFLLLQGRPIGAPVFQMGPFVMNTPEELQRAFADYRATAFGGWPWGSPDPVHGRSDGRFAMHADGRLEHRDMQATP